MLNCCLPQSFDHRLRISSELVEGRRSSSMFNLLDMNPSRVGRVRNVLLYTREKYPGNHRAEVSGRLGTASNDRIEYGLLKPRVRYTGIQSTEGLDRFEETSNILAGHSPGRCIDNISQAPSHIMEQSGERGRCSSRRIRTRKRDACFR